MVNRSQHTRYRQTTALTTHAFPGMLSLEILMALMLVAILFVGITRFQLRLTFSRHEALARLQALQAISSHLEQRLCGQKGDRACRAEEESVIITFLDEKGLVFAREPAAVVRVQKEYGIERKGRVEVITVLN